MKRALFCAMMMATVVATAGARAQALTDPTRPPSALSALSASQAAEEPAGTQLQSILMSSGRKVAVINGTMVPLGGMFGEARVVRITETQVVLKKGEETEVLTMYPGIDKRAVRRSAVRRGESK